MTAGAVEPRYPNFKGIMQAKSKPVDRPTLADLGVDATVNQQILAVEPVPARQAGEKIRDEGEAHLRIVELLEQVKVI